MVRGLILKTIHEVWGATLIFALALGAFEALFAYILPTFFEALPEQWLRVPFVQNIFKALLGTEIDKAIGTSILPSMPWAHPIALALVWAHGIILCTRLPAGEVDHGTIDVLLGLPVSRTRFYVCDSLVCFAAGLGVIATGLLGNMIGARIETHTTIGQLVMVIANLYCLYVAICGMTLFVSSLSDRRGRAVGIVFGCVLASLFLSFLAQFWEPAKSVSFLSVLNYYRPLLILRDGSWPAGDMIILTSVGAVFWFAGAVIFRRRNICTV